MPPTTPSDNNTFFVLALGHYGARTVEVRISLRSTRPAKQLLELDYLEDAVQTEVAKLRERIQNAALASEGAPADAPGER